MLLAMALPATVQAQGLVADPCADAPVRPKAVTDYVAGMLISGTDTPPAPADIAAYTAYKAALDKAKAQDWPNRCQYHHDDLALVTRPASERRIVFIGDSITELWGLADPAFFSNGRVNRGISGQTTGQILLRFQADVVALHPRAVHILAGTNDIAGNTGPESEEDVHNNIAAMVTLAKGNGIRVYLGSLPPSDHFAWSPTLKPAPQILALNTWLRAFATAQGIAYVDYNRVLASDTGAMQPGLSMDGVHPNAAGYRRMASVVPKE